MPTKNKGSAGGLSVEELTKQSSAAAVAKAAEVIKNGGTRAEAALQAKAVAREVLRKGMKEMQLAAGKKKKKGGGLMSNFRRNKSKSKLPGSTASAAITHRNKPESKPPGSASAADESKATKRTKGTDSKNPKSSTVDDTADECGFTMSESSEGSSFTEYTKSVSFIADDRTFRSEYTCETINIMDLIMTAIDNALGEQDAGEEFKPGRKDWIDSILDSDICFVDTDWDDARAPMAKYDLLDSNGAGIVGVSIEEEPSVVFVPKNPLLKMMQGIFLDEATADVCFEVSSAEAKKGKTKTKKKKAKTSESFHAHSHILKACAPMLASLFDLDNSNRGGKIATATITDVKPDIFRHLLYYVYGGSVTETELKAHAKDIIDAADKYSVINLKLEAEAAYVKSTVITTDNAIDNLLYADAKNCALLKETVMNFLAKNSVAAEKISFGKVPGYLMKDLLVAVNSKGISKKEVSETTTDFNKAIFLDEATADVCFEVSSAEAKKGKTKTKTKMKKAKTSESFHAHSHILKSSAPKLASLFDLDNRAATITDVKPDIFRHLLYYVYGGSVTEKELKAHAKDIIDAADKYSVVNLKLEAEAAYVKSTVITTDNAIDNLLYADAKNCALLKETVMNFLANNSVAAEKISFDKVPGYLMKDLLVFGNSKGISKKKASGTITDELTSLSVSALRRKLEEKGLDIDGSRDAMIESIKNNS